MPRSVQFILLALALLTCIAQPCAAQDDESRKTSGDSLSQTLRAMQEELAKLREDNKSMKEQIDELRAKADADWLTEARATEIRNLVQEVLADSDSRASLLNDGVMAGWSEHFFLADAFGRFMLQIDGMTQVRYVLSLRDQVDDLRSGFEVTRTRLTFRGHVFSEDLQYLIRTEASPEPQQGTDLGAFALLDSWFRYTFSNEWSVRAGQFKLPFRREELVSEAERMAVEQSLVNLSTSVGRSQGAEVAYHDNANAWSLMLSNGMTPRQGTILFQLMVNELAQSPSHVPGANTPAIAQNVEFAVTSRYERLMAGTWEQFNSFTSPIDSEYGALLGVAVHWQKNESSSTPIVGNGREQMAVGFTADYSVEWGGASAFVSGTYFYIDSSVIGNFDEIGHLIGLNGMVAVYLAPKWEVFLQAEWAQFEGGNAQFADMGIVTFGFNYYIEGQDVKWTTDAGFSLTELNATWVSDLTGWRQINHGVEPEFVLRSQIQLLF